MQEPDYEKILLIAGHIIVAFVVGYLAFSFISWDFLWPASTHEMTGFSRLLYLMAVGGYSIVMIIVINERI